MSNHARIAGFNNTLLPPPECRELLRLTLLERLERATIGECFEIRKIAKQEGIELGQQIICKEV